MGIIFDTSAIIGIERGHESLDALIAGRAEEPFGISVATVNIRDFEKIPGVKMEKLQ